MEDYNKNENTNLGNTENTNENNLWNESAQAAPVQNTERKAEENTDYTASSVSPVDNSSVDKSSKAEDILGTSSTVAGSQASTDTQQGVSSNISASSIPNNVYKQSASAPTNNTDSSAVNSYGTQGSPWGAQQPTQSQQPTQPQQKIYTANRAAGNANGFAGGNTTPPPTGAGGGAPNGFTEPPKKSSGKAGRTVAMLLACVVLGVGGGAVGAQLVGTTHSSVAYTAPTTSVQATSTDANNVSVSDIAAKAGQSVVSITTENVETSPFYGQQIVSGAGSGVIYTTDGYIVTNNHVVSGANTIKVTLQDGTEYTGKLVGADATSDIAVVKIDATNLTPATLADSDNILVGDYCLAIGNPMGTLGGTVTNGIISATNREINVQGQEMNLLQMSAAVSPGNSGGGLFNSAGELIGVVNAKSSDENTEGLGFAIPSNEAKTVVEELIKNGYVSGRPYLGVSLQAIDSSQTTQYGVSKGGVYIVQVASDSPAGTAGLQTGDMIVSVDNKEVTSVADVTSAINAKKAGDKITMQISRDGTIQSVDVTLEEKTTDTTTTQSTTQSTTQEQGQQTFPSRE